MDGLWNASSCSNFEFYTVLFLSYVLNLSFKSFLRNVHLSFIWCEYFSPSFFPCRYKKRVHLWRIAKILLFKALNFCFYDISLSEAFSYIFRQNFGAHQELFKASVRYRIISVGHHMKRKLLVLWKIRSEATRYFYKFQLSYLKL